MNKPVNKDDSINMTVDNSKHLDKKTLDKNIDNLFQKASTNSFLHHNKNDITNKQTTQGGATKLISSENKNKTSYEDQKNLSVNRPKSTTKKKIDYGRDEKVSADVFYKIKDENDVLKKQQITLNDDMKRVNAAMEKVKYDVLVERRMSDRKVIKVDNEFTFEAENVKIENDKLKDQLRKMKLQ